MLKWLTGGREADKPRAEVKPHEAGQPPKLSLDLARIAEQDLVVVFKHSTACPVSYAADREMRGFMARHPEVAVQTVLVREQRDLSRQIAEWTGIRHESPQVLVFRKGAVVTTGSHGDVTEEFVADAIAQTA